MEAEAPWRQQPATEKQTALLRKLGMTARAGLTKGEAADLLAAVLGDWGEAVRPTPSARTPMGAHTGGRPEPMAAPGCVRRGAPGAPLGASG